MLGVSKSQAKEWLERLVKEGTLEKLKEANSVLCGFTIGAIVLICPLSIIDAKRERP